MKRGLVLLLLWSSNCFAQHWDLELMTGLVGYSGDLSQPVFTPRSAGLSGGLAVKYNFTDVLILRAGFVAGTIQANDKYNKRPDLRARNLNFRSNITEASFCAEINLFEPEFYRLYPYVFAGIGVYHFNPYTYDSHGRRTYLQPLGTEGQGLADYPDRKPYSLTQFCIPFGGGLKLNLNDRLDLVYELGTRVLFTDYIDDVSKTYVGAQTLMANSRPKAAELASRQISGGAPPGGAARGNPGTDDWYFVSGLKLLIRLGKLR